MKDGEQPTRRAWMRSILDRYEQPLTGYAARITGDVESARDVVQEVFLRLCREQAVQTNGHLPQWLFTVCRNKALDVQRKNRRLRITYDEAIAPCDVEAADPSRGNGPARTALGAMNPCGTCRFRSRNGRDQGVCCAHVARGRSTGSGRAGMTPRNGPKASDRRWK